MFLFLIPLILGFLFNSASAFTIFYSRHLGARGGRMVACALGVVWVIIQARLEEMDLVECLPVYQDYIQRVPGFLPKLKRSCDAIDSW